MPEKTIRFRLERQWPLAPAWSVEKYASCMDELEVWLKNYRHAGYDYQIHKETVLSELVCPAADLRIDPNVVTPSKDRAERQIAADYAAWSKDNSPW